MAVGGTTGYLWRRMKQWGKKRGRRSDTFDGTVGRDHWKRSGVPCDTDDNMKQGVSAPSCLPCLLLLPLSATRAGLGRGLPTSG